MRLPAISKRVKVCDLSASPVQNDRGPGLYCQLFNGGFEGYWICYPGDEQDGFMHPFRVAVQLGANGRLGTNEFVRRGFFLLGRRRWPNGEKMTNPSGYDRVMAIRMVDEPTSSETRLQVAREVIELLNKGVTAKDRQVRLPSDFDKTYMEGSEFGNEHRFLSDVLIDRDVVTVVRRAYSNVANTWATDFPEVAATVWRGPPYPPYAVSQLGYVNEPLTIPEANFAATSTVQEQVVHEAKQESDQKTTENEMHKDASADPKKKKAESKTENKPDKDDIAVAGIQHSTDQHSKPSSTTREADVVQEAKLKHQGAAGDDDSEEDIAVAKKLLSRAMKHTGSVTSCKKNAALVNGGEGGSLSQHIGCDTANASSSDEAEFQGDEEDMKDLFSGEDEEEDEWLTAKKDSKQCMKRKREAASSSCA